MTITEYSQFRPHESYVLSKKSKQVKLAKKANEDYIAPGIKRISNVSARISKVTPVSLQGQDELMEVDNGFNQGQSNN